MVPGATTGRNPPTDGNALVETSGFPPRRLRYATFFGERASLLLRLGSERSPRTFLVERSVYTKGQQASRPRSRRSR